MREKRSALAMAALVFVTFPASTTSASGVLSLPRTGQTVSYAAGDDGALQKGVALPSPRFVDNGDGSATDSLTGLAWPKNANVMVSRDPSFDTDCAANDGAVTWVHALDYVAKLNSENYLGHADWRLPNAVELASLVDASQANPALPAGHPFSNLSGLYWSSTTYGFVIAFAWHLDLQVGQAYVGLKKSCDASQPYYLFHVLPTRTAGAGVVALRQTGQVRSFYPGDDGALRLGVGWPVPRYVDHGDGTVSDRLTGLIWTKNDSEAGASVLWQAALDYVAQMDAGTKPNHGYADWRLPNRVELLSLANYSLDVPMLGVGGPFTAVGASHWSSTTYAGTTGKAWDMVGPFWKTTAATAVWPVRTDPAPLAGHAIRGRITFGGAGLAGVSVTLTGALSGVTTTDASGNYAFTYLPDGAYTLTPSLRDHGFAPPGRTVTLVGADQTGADFTSFLTAAYGWVDLSQNIDWLATDASAVQFVGQEGWITSSTWPEIYHTTDGGQTFTIQTTQYPSNALAMRSATEGYAGGTNGRVYRTTDGGTHWNMIGTIGNTLTAISCPPSGATCYAVGNNGTIYSLTGNTLVKMSPIYDPIDGHPLVSNFATINFPVDSGEGWLAGENVLLHYHNGAWGADQTYYGEGGIDAMYFTDTHNGWMVGGSAFGNSPLQHTVDGSNWHAQTDPDSQLTGLFGIHFLDPNDGWAVGANGVILHTTSGGGVWDPGSQTFIGGWAVEAGGMTNHFLRSVFPVDSHTVYVVGNNGTLLKYGQLAGPGATASIAGVVFNDLDGNGARDAGEPGLPGVTVTVTGPGGPYTLPSDASGGYQVAGLSAGSYSVSVNPADPALPAGAVLTTGNNPLPVTLADGQAFVAADFGFHIAAGTPTIWLSTASVTFDPLPAGGGQDRTVTIRNDGTGNLVIGAIAQANPLSPPFSIVSDGCSGHTLTAEGTCSFTVHFAPSALGQFADSFDVPSNDAAHNPVTIQVSGSAVGQVAEIPALSEWGRFVLFGLVALVGLDVLRRARAAG